MVMYNFSAGPAVLPREVLFQAQQELLDWQGTGMSVMEMSHRGKEFMGIAETAQIDFRDLLAIPTHYKVLFLQGGAHLQFAMVPLNLLRGKATADYVNTGEWSKKAIAEAAKYCKVNIVCNSADKNFSYIPPFNSWQCDSDASYLHYTSNETIGGVEFNSIPAVGDVPLVADMSSNILSRVVEVTKHGVIYAGAQKNMGPTGLCIAIVREDLLGNVSPYTPSMLNYKVHADNDSMYNTPPTYAIYIAGLIFKWLKRNGGVAAIEQTNIAKAAMLYSAIDSSNGFYNCPVARADRSRMNVAFTLQNASLDNVFLKQAEQQGLVQLKGHRSVGGMRASIYNAMPLEGVQALVSFMGEFARKAG